jgi:hypothetical protein
MAQFTLEIADADIDRTTAALSQAGGFTEPTAENALSTVMTFIQQTVTNVETANARAKALASVTPDSPVVLTPVAAQASPVVNPFTGVTVGTKGG